MKDKPNNPIFWCYASLISINPRFWHCACYVLNFYQRYTKVLALCKLFLKFYQRYSKVLALCKLFFKFLSALYQGSALCKNFQDFLVTSAVPRSALLKAVLCKALGMLNVYNQIMKLLFKM